MPLARGKYYRPIRRKQESVEMGNAVVGGVVAVMIAVAVIFIASRQRESKNDSDE